MAINHRELLKEYRADPVSASRNLKEGFEQKHVKPNEFDLGELFIECFGIDEFRACKSGRRTLESVYADNNGRNVQESTGAVNTSHFMNITGQIVYSTVLEAYQREDFMFSKLIPEVPTQFLDGEKIAGITNIGPEIAVRKEADPYALAGVGEDWIFTPPIVDRGVIVPVTWEAVFADRTGQLLEQCGKVGYEGAYNKEVRAIDCLIDENVTTHRYNWRGTIIASYNDNTGTHTWDNLQASNALLDWTNLDTAEQLFNQMLDPYTGQPIMIEAKHLITAKQLDQVARRILSATEIRVATPGYATSANPTLTNMANPYLNKYTPVSSRLLYTRLATKTSWFLGDISKYAKYMVAEPLQVMQAPANNPDEFRRRIVSQFRVSERGQHVVVQPRAMVKNTA